MRCAILTLFGAQYTAAPSACRLLCSHPHHPVPELSHPPQSESPSPLSTDSHPSPAPAPAPRHPPSHPLGLGQTALAASGEGSISHLSLCDWLFQLCTGPSRLLWVVQRLPGVRFFSRLIWLRSRRYNTTPQTGSFSPAAVGLRV